MRQNNPQVATRRVRQAEPSELRRRLLPRSGGQGVAGSNPAVPTGQRLVAAQIGLRESQTESHSVYDPALAEDRGYAAMAA
jgi:hypothetical protein